MRAEDNDSVYKDFLPVKRKAQDEAVILYSGGTTGSPKGVMLTNMCFSSIAESCDLMVDDTEQGNSILSYLPIFHGFGLAICIHTPLSIGMKCILIPKINVKKINKIVEKTKPNFLPVIPSILEVMTRDKKASKKSLSSVLCVLSGGDFLSYDLKCKTEKYLKDHGANAVIRIGYGLTESTDEIYKKDNIKLLKQYINLLSKREKEILIDRYGLDGKDELTQKEIAKKLHISRSYVSRIEKRATTKILREFIKNNKNN